MGNNTLKTVGMVVGFILLAVILIFLVAILYLYRTSQRRKRSNRQTAPPSLQPSIDDLQNARGLERSKTQRMKAKDSEAKRAQNLAWGVVDEEAGPQDEKPDYFGGGGGGYEYGSQGQSGGAGANGFGGMNDATIRRAMGRSDSGGLTGAIYSPVKPGNTGLREMHSSGMPARMGDGKVSDNIGAGVGAGMGPRSPPRSLDMPDSHKKMAKGNGYVAKSPLKQSQSSPLNPSKSSSPDTGRPARPARPSEYLKSSTSHNHVNANDVLKSRMINSPLSGGVTYPLPASRDASTAAIPAAQDRYERPPMRHAFNEKGLPPPPADDKAPGRKGRSPESQVVESYSYDW